MTNRRFLVIPVVLLLAGCTGNRSPELSPLPDPTPKMIEARGLMKKGAYDDALKALEEAAKESPKHPLVPYFVAEVKLRRGDLEGAVKGFRESNDLQASADTFQMLGEALLVTGKKRDAEDAFVAARRADPHNATALYWRWLAAAGAGDARHELAALIADHCSPPSPDITWTWIPPYLEGKVSESDLTGAFEKQTGDAGRCEAEFFVGMRKHVLEGPDASKPALERSVAAGAKLSAPPTYYYYSRYLLESRSGGARSPG